MCDIAGVSCSCRRAVMSRDGTPEFRMSLQGHIAELSRRHQSIDKQIEAERTHPACDPVKLSELKRKKLLLKDEMVKLTH